MHAKGSGKKKIAPLIPLLFSLSTQIWPAVANVFAQVPDTTDYFPLNMGDTHTYFNVVQCPPEMVGQRFYSVPSTTKDTVWIGGKKYFVKDKFFLSPDTMRIDENGNVVIRNWDEDKTLYRLNSAVGDTWSIALRSGMGGTYSHKVTLLSRSDSVQVHAGHFSHCLSFKTSFGVESVVDWLAPDVGLVFRCSQEPLELYEAQVKGVKYPVETSVKNRASLVTEFALYQNYPNPFNPETTIEYEWSYPSTTFWEER